MTYRAKEGLAKGNLRSGLHEIPKMIRTFPPWLENNHACKWISDNFPGITHMSEHLENSYKSICLHGCTPIHGERSFFFLKVWDRFDTLKDLLPWIGEQKYIQMDFWQFSRNADICVIPGKLSEIHLHAWVHGCTRKGPNHCWNFMLSDLRVQHK